MQMKFRTSLTLCAAAVLLVACGKKEEAKPVVVAPVVVVVPAPAADSGVVKIGHVGPTSGAIAHLGKDNENGARMAIEELNAAGVTLGGKKVKLELLAEDDAGDPKQGTSVATKLVDAKVAGVIGHLNSGTSIPASAIYSAAGIPQISPSATNPKFTRQGFKTTFRVVADDVHLGKDNENGAKMAVEEWNAKGVTIGGQKMTIELLAEDDAADPKQGTAVAT
ncbi:MAG: ABC transporter substrate-binding protein, partial [Burkholderiaceae bacterium]